MSAVFWHFGVDENEPLRARIDGAASFPYKISVSGAVAVLRRQGRGAVNLKPKSVSVFIMYDVDWHVLQLGWNFVKQSTAFTSPFNPVTNLRMPLPTTIPIASCKINDAAITRVFNLQRSRALIQYLWEGLTKLKFCSHLSLERPYRASN